MSTKPDRKRTQQSAPNKSDIIHMLEDFEGSKNVSVKEFCEMHEITATTFREWHYIYENRHQESVELGGFISLEVNGSESPQPNPSLFAEVQGIRFYQEVSPDYLKALLS